MSRSSNLRFLNTETQYPPIAFTSVLGKSAHIGDLVFTICCVVCYFVLFLLIGILFETAIQTSD